MLQLTPYYLFLIHLLQPLTEKHWRTFSRGRSQMFLCKETTQSLAKTISLLNSLTTTLLTKYT